MLRDASLAVPCSTRRLLPEQPVKLRYYLVAMATLALGSITVTGPMAEPYPNRSITVISPIGPGAPQDTLIRAMAEQMTKDLGQPVIVVNKPGVATTFGPASMATSAKPDGYTVSAVFSPLVLVPQMQKVGFDPSKDFTYILQIASFPIGIATKADSPQKTWRDVLAYAKANPGKVSYGTPGVGTLPHLGIELMAQQASVQFTHVPYNGTNQLIPDLLGGHVTLQVSGMEWKPHVEKGSMRLLAMFSAKRHPSFPDVPTVREFGLPFDVEAQLGIAGPKDMDQAVVARLHDAFKAASETPAMQALYAKLDVDYHYANGADFRTALLASGARMTPVIEKLGLKQEPRMLIPLVQALSVSD